MKTKIKILVLLTILSFKSYGQDSLFVKKDSLKTRVFSFTPRYKGIDKVNGLTFGAGLNFIGEECSIKKVNGMNIEINPINTLLFVFFDPKKFSSKPVYVINGLQLSSGSISDYMINGCNISFFTIGYATNGISVNAMYNHSTKLNGLHIASIGNFSETSNGIFIAGFGNEAEIMNGMQLAAINSATVFNGIQIGISNKSTNFTGIQIGIFNKTDKNKGLQIGFWNINNKRSMPFINW